MTATGAGAAWLCAVLEDWNLGRLPALSSRHADLVNEALGYVIPAMMDARAGAASKRAFLGDRELGRLASRGFGRRGVQLRHGGLVWRLSA